jgi:hypothetical protein
VKETLFLAEIDFIFGKLASQPNTVKNRPLPQKISYFRRVGLIFDSFGPLKNTPFLVVPSCATSTGALTG